MDQQNRWTETATEVPGANGHAGSGAGYSHDPHAVGAGKAELSKRIIAVVIDAVLAMVVGMIPLVGGLVGAAYWLVRDGLEVEFMDRRSLGKKLMKLRPVRLDGQPMDIATSVKRNWMFAFGGVAQILMYIPIIGWLMLIPVALIALALGLFELFKVITDPQGRRLGDSMAGTKVIEVAS